MPGSAQRVLGLLSGAEDAMSHAFQSKALCSSLGAERLFFQLGYLLACLRQYTRCARSSWSGMLTFASWDMFWGGSGVLGCGGYRMWPGVISITHWRKLTRMRSIFSLCAFGPRCLKRRCFVDQGDAFDSACVLNMWTEVRSTRVALCSKYRVSPKLYPHFES